MTSTGTRPVRTVQSRSNEALIEADKELINSLKIFSEASNFVAGLTGTPAQNSPKTPAGNYLAREGDSMIGPLAFGPPLDFSIEVDADNTIDIGPLSDNAQYTSNVQLDDLQTDSAVLDIIANAAFDGQLLFLRTFAPTTPYTISQGTLANGGNIQTGDGSDLSVGDLQTVTLIFDESLKIEANTGGTWRVLSVSSGGGGGISFPIDFPEEDRGTVVVSPQEIDFTDSERHSVIMELTIDIELSLINTTANRLQITSIKLKQDGTGGHALTGFTQTVGNAQVIIDAVNENNGPDDFISFVVEFEDGLFTAYLKTGNIVSGGGGGITSLSELTININKDWLGFGISNFGALSGVTGIDMDGATALIQGVKELRFFDDDPDKNIQSAVDELSYNVPALEQHSFYAGGTEIASFDDTTGLTIEGSHVINMGNNIINTVSEIQFSNANAHTPSNELSIAFDTNDNALKYSVPLTTNFHMFFANTDLLATFTRVGSNEGLLSIQAVTAAFLQATETLFLSTFTNSTPTNGDIWRDLSSGEFQFRQNGVTDTLGGIPSSIVDGDSNVTVNDSVPEITFTLNASQVGEFSTIAFLPSVPIDMTASATNPNIIGLGKLQFTENDDTLFGTQNIITVRDTDGKMLFNVGVVSDTFEFAFAGTTEWIFTNTQLTGNNIILDNTLTFNDGTADPAGNGQFARNGDILGLQIPEFAVRRSTTVAANAPELSLVRVDANPDPSDTVGEISFKVDDSGVFTTYAAITATIIDVTDNAAMTFLLRADNGLISAMALNGDDNNQRFQLLMSGTSQFRIQPVFDRMGYFVTPQVTDFSLVLGTAGSIEMPAISNGSPSLTDLNQAFGAFDGAFGYEAVDERLYIRESSTRWVFFSAAGAVT